MSKSKSDYPCPHCKNDDALLIEETFRTALNIFYTCMVCSKSWKVDRNGSK